MTSTPAGLLDSLRGLTATSVGVVRTRIELLKVEAQEEVGRVAGLMLWGVAAVLLTILGTAFLAIFLTVLLWDTHRLLALGVFAALFLGAASVAITLALRLRRQESQLFAASLAELRRDESTLHAAPQRDEQP